MEQNRYSLLVVDDERQSVQLLGRIFRQGYTVYSATSGQEALEILKKNKIDLIITDQRMPQMTGMELLKSTYETHPDLVRIILTAFTDIQDLIEAINLGYIYRYITKPFDIDELKLTVKQALEAYELSQERKRLLRDLSEKNLALEKALSDLKTAQEELIKNERISAIGRVMNGVLHDIKGPLSGIKAVVQMWEHGTIPKEKEKEYAQKVSIKIDYLVDMLQEILDFARGDFRLNLGYISLDNFLEDNLYKLKDDVLWSGIKVETNFSCNKVVRIDPKRMSRVLSNLIRNAYEAIIANITKNSKKKEEMFLKITSSIEDNMGVIKITDSGIGIPESVQKHLFTLFFTRGKEDGNGLGLAISKKIVEDHQGTISVQSKEGEGATFIIKLPIIDPSAIINTA